MTFDSVSALRRLQALQQQIAEAPRLGESLRAAWDGHDLQEARCVTIDARRHLSALAMTTALLKAQVLATDGLDAALESLSELALRDADGGAHRARRAVQPRPRPVCT